MVLDSRVFYNPAKYYNLLEFVLEYGSGPRGLGMIFAR